jgi:putative hemolysin
MMVTWLLLLLVLAAVGMLTAGGAAIRVASRQWLREWVERQLGGRPAEQVRIERPHRLLLGATAANVLLLTAGGVIVGASGASPVVLLTTVIIFALLALLFGHAVPRAIGQAWAPRLEPALLPAVRGVTVALRPALRLADAAARAMIGGEINAGPLTDREEIEELLRERELEGLDEPDELELITGVMQFGDRLARDVMTPRTSIFAVDVGMPPRELALAVAQAGYSRVPVYRDTLDEIIGMVHVFDVLASRGETSPKLRPVMVAPETKPAREMLFEMLKRQQHLAVVLDEFGGTAGIVTLEDLLEEIVGDIRDEHDEPAAQEAGQSPRAAVVDGSTELRDVARRFAVSLGETEMAAAAQTVGGALTRGLGRIPVVGERVLLGALEITVVAAEPTRVSRVLVQRSAAVAPPADLRAEPPE